MNQKKKQSIVAVVATVLTVTCVMSPVASVYATETDTTPQQNETTAIKSAQENKVVPIDEENFPDKTFRNYVKSWDGNGDDKLTTDEIGSTTLLNVMSRRGIKDLTGIEHFTALTDLDCSGTGITSLDVSKNTALTNLNCANTGIEELDVSNNEKLESLELYETKITSLDIRKNPNLLALNCRNTNLTSLDVSNNLKLHNLICFETKITSLDVSNNTNLGVLWCYNTPLAYLNLGTNTNLTQLNIGNFQPVNLEVNADSFDITDKFTGIDKEKISKVIGAKYNLTTGVMSNYEATKKITYKYECGTSFDGPQTMDMTLNLTLKSVISIKEDLSKTYDGTAVTPEVEKEGSTKDVTYQWERKKNANDWEDIDSAPKDVGTYRVTATLPSEDGYTGATSEPKEFTISQATNDWTDTLSIKDWTYNETANNPTATAKFGTVDYLYSGSKNGTYTDVVPTKVGTWYVKASVAETENYTGLETIIAFKIEPKNVENNKITVSDIKNDKDIENLVVKDEDKVLEKGIDYEVEKKQKGNKVEVVITFKGNYTGTITKTYTVNVDKPKDSVSVSTGDTTHTGLLAMITLLSASCIVFLAEKKRRKEF